MLCVHPAFAVLLITAVKCRPIVIGITIRDSIKESTESDTPVGVNSKQSGDFGDEREAPHDDEEVHNNEADIVNTFEDVAVKDTSQKTPSNLTANSTKSEGRFKRSNDINDTRQIRANKIALPFGNDYKVSDSEYMEQFQYLSDIDNYSDDWKMLSILTPYTATLRAGTTDIANITNTSRRDSNDSDYLGESREYNYSTEIDFQNLTSKDALDITYETKHNTALNRLAREDKDYEDTTKYPMKAHVLEYNIEIGGIVENSRRTHADRNEHIENKHLNNMPMGMGIGDKNTKAREMSMRDIGQHSRKLSSSLSSDDAKSKRERATDNESNIDDNKLKIDTESDGVISTYPYENEDSTTTSTINTDDDASSSLPNIYFTVRPEGYAINHAKRPTAKTSSNFNKLSEPGVRWDDYLKRGRVLLKRKNRTHDPLNLKVGNKVKEENKSKNNVFLKNRTFAKHIINKRPHEIGFKFPEPKYIYSNVKSKLPSNENIGVNDNGKDDKTRAPRVQHFKFINMNVNENNKPNNLNSLEVDEYIDVDKEKSDSSEYEINDELDEESNDDEHNKSFDSTDTHNDNINEESSQRDKVISDVAAVKKRNYNLIKQMQNYLNASNNKSFVKESVSKDNNEKDIIITNGNEKIDRNVKYIDNGDDDENINIDNNNMVVSNNSDIMNKNEDNTEDGDDNEEKFETSKNEYENSLMDKSNETKVAVTKIPNRYQHAIEVYNNRLNAIRAGNKGKLFFKVYDNDKSPNVFSEHHMEETDLFGKNNNINKNSTETIRNVNLVHRTSTNRVPTRLSDELFNILSTDREEMNNIDSIVLKQDRYGKFDVDDNSPTESSANSMTPATKDDSPDIELIVKSSNINQINRDNGILSNDFTDEELYSLFSSEFDSSDKMSEHREEPLAIKGNEEKEHVAKIDKERRLRGKTCRGGMHNKLHNRKLKNNVKSTESFLSYDVPRADISEISNDATNKLIEVNIDKYKGDTDEKNDSVIYIGSIINHLKKGHINHKTRGQDNKEYYTTTSNYISSTSRLVYYKKHKLLTGTARPHAGRSNIDIFRIAPFTHNTKSVIFSESTESYNSGERGREHAGDSCEYKKFYSNLNNQMSTITPLEHDKISVFDFDESGDKRETEKVSNTESAAKLTFANNDNVVKNIKGTWSDRMDSNIPSQINEHNRNTELRSEYESKKNINVTSFDDNKSIDKYDKKNKNRNLGGRVMLGFHYNPFGNILEQNKVKHLAKK